MSKCKSCKKKLNVFILEMHKCKCTNVYCNTHLHDHNCSFDHVKAYKKLLDKKLVRIVSNRGYINF